MTETTLMILLVAAYIVLQRWILPRFGVHT
jgi:hypothetical protein